MLEFGAGIYYDITTMQVIYVSNERAGAVIETDIFYDMDYSPELANTPLVNIRCLTLKFGDDQNAAVISNGLHYPLAPLVG